MNIRLLSQQKGRKWVLFFLKLINLCLLDPLVMPDGGLLSLLDDLLLLSGSLLLLSSDIECLFFEGHLLLLVDINVGVLQHKLSDGLNTFWYFAKKAFCLHIILRPSGILFSFLGFLNIFFHCFPLCFKVDLSTVFL